MATAICGGSKSYLIRQNVTILLKKYGYFGYLLQTKVTTAICGRSKSYLVRQNVAILVKKYDYFGCMLQTKVTTPICLRLPKLSFVNL